jgi:hypothetical protein
VKGERAHERLIERRHLVCAKVLDSKQPENRTCSHTSEELAFGISPQVFLGASDIDRVWRVQSD